MYTFACANGNNIPLWVSCRLLLSTFCKKKKQRQGFEKSLACPWKTYADFWSTTKLKGLFLWSLGVYDCVNEVIDISRFYEYFVRFTEIQKIYHGRKWNHFKVLINHQGYIYGKMKTIKLFSMLEYL